MTKSDLYFIPGGIGKCISFSSYLSKIENPISICSGWRNLFVDHPKVLGSYELTSYYDTQKNKYFASHFANYIHLDPYFSKYFLYDQRHLSECFQLMCGISDPTKKADLFFNKEEVSSLLPIVKKIDPFVLVQFSGSDESFIQQNDLYTRSVLKEQAQEIINILNFDLKLNVVNVKSPENKSKDFENICDIDFPLDYKKYLCLLSFSRGHISIDSFLQHGSSNKNKTIKGVVLWGSTDHSLFGYEHNINMKSSVPYQMKFNTNEIIDNFKKINEN